MFLWLQSFTFVYKVIKAVFFFFFYKCLESVLNLTPLNFCLCVSIEVFSKHFSMSHLQAQNVHFIHETNNNVSETDSLNIGHMKITTEKVRSIGSCKKDAKNMFMGKKKE